MPISFVCTSCGKRLRGGDQLAGRTVACPFCQARVPVPKPDADPAEDAYQAAPPPAEDEADDEPEPAPRVKSRPERSKTYEEPLRSNETPLWLRHLHWLLALAIIPLAFSLLHKSRDEGDTLGKRLARTLENSSPDVQVKVIQTLEQMDEDRADMDDLFRVLPGGKLEGALLPRRTFAHWAFALGATVLFLGFIALLAIDGSANIVHVLLVGLFTATIGILLLLGVQYIADATQGVWVRGRGIVTLLFYVVKLIGFSYQAASDPENGFILSFLGFTVGVGFCEELVKLLPVLVRFGRPNDSTWREAFLWGLASGAGFGIAEGIMYSSRYYNGISGGEIYLVRFLSCVALHALWTGSAAIMMHQKQHLLHGVDSWYEYIIPVVVYAGVPIILHGLYDTMLKKDYNAAALFVAIVSFAFLAGQIYLLRGADDAEATAEMLREYKRRRQAMS